MYLFLIIPLLLSSFQLTFYLIYNINYTLNQGMLIVSIFEIIFKIISLFIWYKFKIIFSIHQLLSVLMSLSNLMFYLNSSSVNQYMIISYSFDSCITLFIIFINTNGFIKVNPSDDWICSICLDSEKKSIVKTTCSHTFHLKCIEKSLDYSKLCPMCRDEII